MKRVLAQQPSPGYFEQRETNPSISVTATVDVPLTGMGEQDFRPQIKQWLETHLREAHAPIRLASFDIGDTTNNIASVSATYVGVEEDVTEYIQQRLGAPITSMGSKKASWRQSLAAFETPNKGFKYYYGEHQTFPGYAEFKKDLPPSKGDSAKKELEAFQEGNRLMESDKKNEEKYTEFGSPIVFEEVKRENVLDHNKEEGVLPKYASKKSWRTRLSFHDNLPFEQDSSSQIRCPFCKHSGPEHEFSQGRNGSYTCSACRGTFDPHENAMIGSPAKSPIRLPQRTMMASKHSFIEKEKGGYMVKSEEGKNLRNHPTTHEKAVKQLQAIEINKSKEGNKKSSWRNIFRKKADISFQNRADGTVKIDITSHPNEPLTQNPNTLQPQPPGPAEVQQEEAATTGKAAEASKKKGNVFGEPPEDFNFFEHGFGGDTGNDADMNSPELEDQIKKYQKEAWDYFSQPQMHYVPDTDDIFNYIVDAWSEENGLSIDHAPVDTIKKVLGMEDDIMDVTSFQKKKKNSWHTVLADLPESSIPESSDANTDWASLAQQYGVIFQCIQPSLHPSMPAMPMFNDPLTRSTFMKKPTESLPDAIARSRKPFHLPPQQTSKKSNQEITVPASEFFDEHKHLIPTLEHGSQEARLEEGKEQKEEVKGWREKLKKGASSIETDNEMGLPEGDFHPEETCSTCQHKGLYYQVKDDGFEGWYCPECDQSEDKSGREDIKPKPPQKTRFAEAKTRVFGIDTQRTTKGTGAGKQTHCSANNTVDTDNPVYSWVIRKEGNLELIGRECKTHAGIFIEANRVPIESVKLEKTDKNLQWRELISEAEWVAKFEDMLIKKSWGMDSDKTTEVLFSHIEFEDWKKELEDDDRIHLISAHVDNNTDPPGMVRVKMMIDGSIYNNYIHNLEQRWHAAIASQKTAWEVKPAYPIEYDVTGQAYRRGTDRTIGRIRTERINVQTNELFNGSIGIPAAKKELLKTKRKDRLELSEVVVNFKKILKKIKSYLF